MEILPDKLPEEPARKQVEALGCRLAYLEAGRGAAVVLLHGAADNADSFRLLMRELSSYRRVIALDLPGCGESGPPPDDRYGVAATARYVAAALDELKVYTGAVCGHERGGAVATFLALLDPARVKALCLLSATLSDNLVLPLSFRMGGFPPARWLAPYLLRRGALRSMLKARYDLLPPYFHDRVRKLAAALDLPHRRAQLAMVQQHDPEEIDALIGRLPDLEVPALIFHGARDRRTPLETARYLERQISSSKLHVVERCGHAPHEEAPNETATHLLDWLARWGA